MYEKAITLPMAKEINAIELDDIYYKYIPLNNDNSIKNLINHELYISDPKNFNDPFDCPVYRDNYNKSIGLARVLDRIRVSCFSRNPKSILMWSHYGNSHKGICVGYRITKTYLSEYNLHFDNIEYRDGIPSPTDKENYKSFLSNTFYIKNKEWSYEEEVRVVGYDLDANPIPAPKIEEIIFGINISDSDRKTVEKIFRVDDNLKFKEVVEENTISIKIQDV